MLCTSFTKAHSMFVTTKATKLILIIIDKVHVPSSLRGLCGGGGGVSVDGRSLKINTGGERGVGQCLGGGACIHRRLQIDWANRLSSLAPPWLFFLTTATGVSSRMGQSHALHAPAPLLPPPSYDLIGPRRESEWAHSVGMQCFRFKPCERIPQSLRTNKHPTLAARGPPANRCCRDIRENTRWRTGCCGERVTGVGVNREGVGEKHIRGLKYLESS